MDGYKGTPEEKREVLARALIDPAFREMLLRDPEEVLGCDLSKEDLAAIAKFKEIVPALGDVVSSLSSNVLCGGGGGCGSSVVVAAKK